MIRADSVLVTVTLYVLAVTFFSLWRFERARRIEFVRLAREESFRQHAAMAALGIDFEDDRRGV